ncbi:neuroguidin-like [Centruroides sculpturatus]|uniref:neuroguidin-like n=1 Tax=Centruroides sculpturatus TaxID=218467 RepID=UPI000C6E1787|nr:neuroguidin-like [Centruroides sculpturatus]
MACVTPENIVARDLPEALASFKEITEQANNVRITVETLLKRIEDNEFKTEKGNSFLELKNQMLLSYLINLTYIIHNKAIGKSIEGEPAIERLVEIRTVLEKMRPIDQKLKYQIDKLLKSSVAGNIDPNDPIHLKPNIGNIQNKESEEEMSGSEEEEDQNETKKSKVYVAPKLLPMHYDGDDTLEDKRKKLFDKARKRVLNSSIMQELKREFDEGPEEIWDSVGHHKLRQNKEMKERQEYEEKYMMRMPLTKKQKHNYRRLPAASGLGNLAKFEDVSILDADFQEMSAPRTTARKKKERKKREKKRGLRKKRR